ncbi:serine/threonine-protein kinase Tor2p [Trichomonascus vanleenenianus]|uniref:serine/threonine-protein kinase Tor2p n=1 Tax=Trichomonascus vanleenenianus TaxID=2268995 RepID=UPI003ECA26AF
MASTSQQPENVVINNIFSGLRSRSSEERIRAAKELRNHLVSVSPEMMSDQYTRHNNDINKRIFELLRSPDPNTRIGAILAIDQLIDADTGEEAAVKITRFANYIRSVVLTSDIDVMRAACNAMGKLTIFSGLAGDLVDFEVKRSLEWLQSDRQEVRRHAAVLNIKSIATYSPTLLYAYVGSVLDNIWIALRDPKVAIRVDAASCLKTCLDIIYQRDSHQRQQWFTKISNEAQHGFKLGTVEAIHGSLLVYRELLRSAGMFMQPKYTEVCEIVLKYKDYKDPLVRRTVVTILPCLSSYNPMEFTKRYLVDSMAHLIGQLKRERDRSLVFEAIGQIATSVRSNMAFYLEPILENVREGLSSRGRGKKEQEGPIFDCLGMLAASVGQALAKHISREILDLIFSCGLSESLNSCLIQFVTYIPPLQITIRDRLLNILSYTLSGNPFKPPGSPNSSQQMNESAAKEYREAMLQREGTSDMTEEKLITLALNMLRTFDFKGYSLSEFVKNCTVNFMEHSDANVRKAAALTSCELYVNDPICFQVSANSLKSVSFVLEKLLTVAITDPSAEIRYEVLQSLNPIMDPHLSQAENVRLLFIALHDEVFAVRHVAIKVIGRLTQSNPAYVIPSLRKTLIQLLTELEFSNNVRNKEESAKLLSALVASSKGLVKPYVRSILRVLLQSAQDPSSSVAASVMTTIGEVSKVGAEEMKEYIPELMPLILETLQDQSSSVKREAALKTLGHLASSSGYVIEPLLHYPQLLGILVNILRTEPSLQNRRETVRLMGILGALDPYKLREVEQKNEYEEEEATPTDMKLLMKGMSPTNDEYYPTVVITTLMGLLKDNSLASHHTSVAQAILFIFKSLGLKCVPFLSQIIPGLLGVMRTSTSTMTEFFFRQLTILVNVVKQHIRIYLDSIFEIVKEFFHNPTLQPTILTLIDAIAQALDGEFKIYVPTLLPMMVGVLQQDKVSNEAAKKVMNSFIVFGSNIEEYVHLVIPNIVNMFEYAPLQLRLSAIECIGDLCRTVNLNDMASRIIHPLLRVIANGNEELRRVSVDTLCSLCYQMGSEFTVFVEVINKVLARYKVHSSNYEQLVAKLLNGEPLPQNLNPYRKRDKNRDEASPADIPTSKIPVNQQHLKQAWDVSQRSTKEDWFEWLRRFSVELLKESPSHAIRACASIAVVYTPLAKELFNASFFSCWTELYDQYKEDLVKSIETALTSVNIPPEVLQTLLNLAEFMEHDEKPLPMDIRTLALYAQKCHAYAKALHYKELEFIQEPSTPTIEALISINNQLQQTDAAIGILKHAQRHHNLQLKETWYEKLQRWEDALEAYNKRSEAEESMEVTMGKMRCLHALGEWEQLSKLAQEKWTNSSNEVRRSIAPLAAAASWGLAQWEKMDQYISVMKSDSPDRSFFNSILFIHRNNFEEAAQQIIKARDQLITELTALVSESYNRAYGVIVRVQMLSELEEIITYKSLPDNSETKITMRQTWMKRLKGCQRNVDIWERMLKVRALVVTPKEDMDMWIKFANLCRKSGRNGIAEKSLNQLLEDGDGRLKSSRAPPQVVYAQLKYMWATHNKREALNHLFDFTSRMASDLDLVGDDYMSQPLPSERPGATKEIKDYTKLLARCFLKQGEWQVALRDDWKTEAPDTILGAYLLATHFDPTWYKAWHNWALANFEVVSMHESKRLKRASASERENGAGDVEGYEVPNDLVPRHVCPAITGFFHSIALSEQKSLQDTLRLLTLWFKFGGLPEPAAAMADGTALIRIEVWLDVVPQLITRIHQPDPVVSKALHSLLTELGKRHPQALVYPLTVAIKSDSVSRQKAATTILDKMRTHSPRLVDQAEMVSHELIRVAVLWHEQWHEGLEDASRFFFGDHNIDKMFATLEPLHKTLERGPETLREVSFQTAFGRDLHDAYEWALSFKKTGDLTQLNQAWDIYYSVFRRITRQLPQLQNLELQYVSPKLMAVQNLELAVPGTYVPGKQVISIVKFETSMSVISSKQRPRKLTCRGNDGKDYTYILKGHEDIRQDNLVMQLFGLVNTLLTDDPDCFKRHLNIQQYPAIPLSPKSGLLGFVPHSDTFHQLIREYREGKILLNIEHRIMLQMAPEYDNLTHLQKIEVFTYALDNTRGQDLYRVLWLKSRSSEAWLERRTQYTRSLAVMSMVGYILGLGDRHPSNLMLDRLTGKVIHIDFGDCFEAAMLREKFPEKVPFRLTRMLTYAMEVSGIEGSFRITCEHVMRLLRDNSESLMAILEAFAYDPLINWGFEIPTAIDKNKGDERRTSLAYGNVDPAEMKRRAQLDQTESSKAGQSAERIQRAEIVLSRIKQKLTGNDFPHHKDLEVPDQVDRLIQQATNIENLCQHYVGWCSFW